MASKAIIADWTVPNCNELLFRYNGLPRCKLHLRVIRITFMWEIL